MSDTAFSEFSAQDTHLAALEAQEWIEAVVGKKFPKGSFRESLEDGVLLCELMNKVEPGSIRRINKSRSPIGYLDNIQQFLYRCQDLGMNDAQLFDSMDLQEIRTARKVGVKRSEADRRIRSVCITLYWLGRTVAEMEDYTGPQLDLNLFKKLMKGNLSGPKDEDDKESETVTSKQHNHFHKDNGDSGDPHPEFPTDNGPLDDQLELNFEQEQTADELLADIQNAVDEMLQDFQSSPVTANPPPVAQKTKAPKKRDKPSKRILPTPAEKSSHPTEHIIHIRSKNSGFGFQIMGGMDSDLSAQVDYIVPGSPADNSILEVGDKLIHVNSQDIQHLSHTDLVSVIKKAGQAGEVALVVKRTTEKRDSDGGDICHTLPSNFVEADLGFSRRESREKWEEENEERERQAQEIALLYPQRNTGSHPTENGISIGPPPSFGREPLPPLVEHQEEAMFEQIQEMIEAAPSPPPSPPTSPQARAPPSAPSSSQSSSHPASPFTISPTNQFSDDKETIERELEELTLMEATKPSADEFDLSDSLSEDEGQALSSRSGKEEQSGKRSNEQKVDEANENESDNMVAIKIDSFRVEESSSPLPLSPITEVSSDADLYQMPERTVSTSPALPSDDAEDPVDMLDRELNELMKFSESNNKSGTSSAPPPTVMSTTPTQDEGTRPLSEVVTPPPMFSSPPPPKPTSVAPKRVVKRPAPPPPKPKPKQEVSSPTETKTPEQEMETPKVNGDSPGAPISPDAQEAFLPTTFQRSWSPDLVTQMQELAYSKSITSELDMTDGKPRDSAQLAYEGAQMDDRNPSSPYRHSWQQLKPSSVQGGLQLQPSAGVQLPFHQNYQQQQVFPPQQSVQTPPQNLALSSNGHTAMLKSASTETTTPKLIEVLGDIKIHRVVKTRWTPKNTSSAEASPAQTPQQEQSQTHVNRYKERSATLPNIMHHQQNGGTSFEAFKEGKQGYGISSAVVARGIGSVNPQDQKRYSQPTIANNPYQPQTLQQQQQRQRSLAWRSQEELRINQQKLGQQMHSRRLASTPNDSLNYRVQKSKSLPRGSGSNSYSTGRGRAAGGYQVAYAVQAGNPYDLCSRCHQSLGKGTVLSVPGLKTQYHVKCFVCRVCRGMLTQGGQSTTVMMKNMLPHCQFCISGDNGTQTTEC